MSTSGGSSGGGGAPSGPAGGSLSGTYPNPGLASTITAGGPQGDSAHTQVLTWNAAGQLSAVTNTAISGSGIDLAGIYPLAEMDLK